MCPSRNALPPSTGGISYAPGPGVAPSLSTNRILSASSAALTAASVAVAISAAAEAAVALAAAADDAAVAVATALRASAAASIRLRASLILCLSSACGPRRVAARPGVLLAAISSSATSSAGTIVLTLSSAHYADLAHEVATRKRPRESPTDRDPRAYNWPASPPPRSLAPVLLRNLAKTSAPPPLSRTWLALTLCAALSGGHPSYLSVARSCSSPTALRRLATAHSTRCAFRRALVLLERRALVLAIRC